MRRPSSHQPEAGSPSRSCPLPADVKSAIARAFGEAIAAAVRAEMVTSPSGRAHTSDALELRIVHSRRHPEASKCAR
jgi:hypothetical protein